MTISVGRPPVTPAAQPVVTSDAPPGVDGAAPAAAPTQWLPTDPAPRPAVTAAVAPTPLSPAPNDFDLIPGRYPDAVPLPVVLAAIGSTPEGRAALNKVMDDIQAKTGLPVPPQQRSEVMANPTELTKLLEATPAQMSAGAVELNRAYRAGKVKAPEVEPHLLPRQFDLAHLDAVVAPRPKAELKELGPGLFQGDLPSSLPDMQVKRNRVMAEVFDRLAKNASAGAQPFEVTYAGKAYTQLATFVSALQADGYTVDARFDTRVANFANLKTTVPGSNPPISLDVPAPLLVKTGLRDGLGAEALVPAAHSELVVSLKAGPTTQGPRLDAEVKFYQGVSGTGFFPCKVWADPSWCGGVTTATVSGADALKAVRLAGAFTDLITTAARQAHLFADGYGLTGVCNDSVAIIEQAVTGRVAQYPLLMNDGLVLAALALRLAEADPRGEAPWPALRQAVLDVPSDTGSTASTRRRALASLPWAAGAEPLASAAAARKIISSQ